MSAPHPDREWQAVLAGDTAAFRRLAEPVLPELLAAAQHEVLHHRSEGDFDFDTVTAHELVGDTLLRAWQDRFARPVGVDLRVWLLRTQMRVVQSLVRRRRLEQRLTMLSLEEPIDSYVARDDDAELVAIWPDAVEPLWFEDILADAAQAPDPGAWIAQRDELVELARCVLVLHDRHHVPMKEVAEAIHVPLSAAESLLSWARDESVVEEETPE